MGCGASAQAAQAAVGLPAKSTEDYPAEQALSSVEVDLPHSGAIIGFRNASKPIEKYVYLRQLQQQDAASFYRLLMSNSMEIMPYVYTPTVGEACQTYHKLPITTQGVYITADDAGRVGEALRRRAPPHVAEGSLSVVVVTDSERILGLGDLGAGGMGIAEGKILLYTVCAGVAPTLCLPVCLDVGTNNRELLDDPGYKGLRRERLTGEAYDALVEEFMTEMRSWQPRCLVQFEDFGNTNAFRILEKYRHVQLCFNDDIQGTACVALAGILSALRATGCDLLDQKVNPKP
jgi:malate dehydrogenase (oxaloacetate-decarboxylating)(NADP+)